MEVFISSIVSFIIEFGVKNPKIVPFLAIAYLVGIGVKLVREAYTKFVAETPTKSDDLQLEKFEKSQAAKIVFFITDLLIRFKVK